MRQVMSSQEGRETDQSQGVRKAQVGLTER